MYSTRLRTAIYEDSYPLPPFSSRPASTIATTSGSSAMGTPPDKNGTSSHLKSGYESAFFPDGTEIKNITVSFLYPMPCPEQ